MQAKDNLTITTTLSSSPEQTLKAARDALAEWGGTLTGTLDSGETVAKTPVGDVAGSYSIEGELLTVRVLRKPRLAPSAVVRGAIEGFFANLKT